MKNLIIIIGTILLGVIIVNTMILGDEGSLKSAAEDMVAVGSSAVESIGGAFGE
ncbi:hypothetical protein SAMN05216515_11338 [Eubacterium pyruvativorans]|uniref:Uncharacterized protein n=1 Tax=Eubacterium pyruvativorans TaxID=155865 RepID=A0A1I7H5G0_9FIRM|nr:hypothetical protein [Eubacterium pyruvativorans]MDO5568107.1 hypothetical protein [Eubacteriales bacterium]MCI5746443.1 hypothetical protein [Eubacterium pyruvativorans]MDD6707381.1 hypothetical protein [Eubacterium pyruvativorans]MDD7684343.1 hypothetical protein [Eubacterium pyruvativorans]MDY4048862.1 hypothetical protein [Eubacterium pyruvativorans]